MKKEFYTNQIVFMSPVKNDRAYFFCINKLYTLNRKTQFDIDNTTCYAKNVYA